MYWRRSLCAAGLTALFCCAAIYADSALGPDNETWRKIQSVINVPADLVSGIVGPGHGFLQLALPFIVSIFVYFYFFWGLITIAASKWLKRKPGAEPIFPCGSSGKNTDH